jgi:hypothetical protein
MKMINVDGLPDSLVRSLEALVNSVKQQVVGATDIHGSGDVECLKRAAGSWAEADEEEFSQWLDETYRARKADRRESNG